MARTRILQQLICLACVQDQCLIVGPQLGLLWTGSFGQLLQAPTLADEEWWQEVMVRCSGGLVAERLVKDVLPCALPLGHLRSVMQHVADVQEDWPLEAQIMWRIGHSRATAREVSDVWLSAQHLLQDELASAEGSPVVHPYFLSGIIMASGILCRSLQRVLLCNGCCVPDTMTPAAYVAACADALHELRNSDDLRGVLRISGPGGDAVRRMALEEIGI
eukprot:gnl/MRDRNA2_/MRDRNA2_39847_c0_seq1.p1 gnl/MRDRNA2_/MRDRNA2_39847_c0~~gnl/MRDRNA2_/MRDRNA2_39847_c0_seq1.p1  ORF type:complete len:247 (-),score=52.56 gnl/MRDRNA2_/MRDRNA2_39847_c0_seq1:48-704(-)